MAKVSASEFADKWASRLSGATDEIRRGVERVTESPMAKAAQKKAKWVARMTDPKTQEKWAANTGAVTLEEWKRALLDIGLGRISGGTTKAKPKMQRFAEALLAYQDSVAAKVRAMPDVTLEDSKARMIAWFDAMSKFRKPSGR